MKKAATELKQIAETYLSSTGKKGCYITTDGTIFNVEAIDHARNWARQNGLTEPVLVGEDEFNVRQNRIVKRFGIDFMIENEQNAKAEAKAKEEAPAAEAEAKAKEEAAAAEANAEANVPAANAKKASESKPKGSKKASGKSSKTASADSSSTGRRAVN